MNVDDAVRLAVEHDYNLPNISRRYRYMPTVFKAFGQTHTVLSGAYRKVTRLIWVLTVWRSGM